MYLLPTRRATAAKVRVSPAASAWHVDLVSVYSGSRHRREF
jgi:hypothetical protein